MKFPYVNIRGHFQPIIPVVLRYAGACQTFALVDSGADASIFHAEYAAEIGIENFKNGVPMEFAGVSGAPLRAYRHVVDLEVGGNRFPEMYIAFSSDLSPDSFNILGQADFFALFPVKFNFRKREITLMSSSNEAA